MFTLLPDIYTHLYKNLFTDSVFCNIFKSFDCVNLKLPFNKLQFFGIYSVSLEGLKSYLYNRQQVVKGKVAESFLGWKTLNISVPQGSVPEPVIFLLFIKNIC